MKFSATIIKDNGEVVLRPCYSSDAEQIRKLKQETEYFFEVKANRNALFHAKAMALFRIGFENQERYENFDDYRRVATMNAGFYDAIETNKGTVYVPKSLAFDKMDQIEFQEVFERVLDVISKQLGSAPQDIRDNLNSFM